MDAWAGRRDDGGRRRGVCHAFLSAGLAGFTLVEMLVVLGVIVILAAILVPFLGGAKEHVYNTICQGNLDQLGVAMHTHGARNRATIPSASSWMASVGSSDAAGVLKCPKGFFRGGGAGSPATTPNVEEVGVPTSAVFNDLESNITIHLFPEWDSYILPADVRVDITEPGYYENNYGRSSGVIPAGTSLGCWFIHFDPVGSQQCVSSGAIRFDVDILGLIVQTGSLDQTDAILGAPGTVYPTGQSSRGFENNAEKITLEADMRTLTIHRFHSTFPGEQLRILVAPAGEASYGMNNRVEEKMPRPAQLMLVEYHKSIADCDFRGTDDAFGEWLAPRHFGKANALLVDGSVRLLAPEALDPNLPMWAP